MAVSIDDDRDEIVFQRTVRESGRSVVVTIPPEILNAADFGCQDDVDVWWDRDAGEIKIRRGGDADGGE